MVGAIGIGYCMGRRVVRFNHRIINDRMEKAFKGRRYVYNLL